MASFLADLRLAGRSLRKAPVFCLTAILTLGLGVGLNAAVFSAVYGIVLRPLDLPQPERLVSVGQDMEARGGKRQELTGWAVFAGWRARQRSFSALAAYLPASVDLSSVNPPETVDAVWVSHEVFAVLGVRPAIGRGFLEEEEVRGRDAVAVLSYGLWKRRFAGDPSLIGKTVAVNGQPRIVVGILPPGFHCLMAPQAKIWLLQSFQPPWQDWGHAYVGAVARLAPGISHAAAQTEMNRVAATVESEHPDEMRGIGVSLQPLLETVVGAAREPLLGLLGAVALLLAAAGCNVANLFLSRAMAHRTDLALRAAVGAGPLQIVRLVVAECLWIAAGAAAAGLCLGFAYLAALRGLAPPQTPRLDAVRLDGAVAVFTVAAALAATFAAGLVPALWISRRGASTALRAGAGTTSGRPVLRLRGALVAAEIAASILLLDAAGALLRSLALLRRVEPGFRTESLVVGRLEVMPAHFPDLGDVRDFMARYEERLDLRREIAAAGLVSAQPLADASGARGFALDRQDVTVERQQSARLRAASAGYFRAVGAPLAAGRFFAESDTAQSTPVALVNETFARRFLGSRLALGHRIRSEDMEAAHAPWRLIVGVVRDFHGRALDQPPEAEVYFPLAQVSYVDFTVVARASRSTSGAIAAVQQVAREIRPGQVVQRPETMTAVLDRGLAPRRFTASLILSFAAVGLLLAAAGIYGVTALAVSQRQSELAIRLTLGAQPSALAGVILRWSAALILCGVLVGLAGSLAAHQILASVLYGIGPLDGLVLIAAASFLGIVAFAAALVPALRARQMNATEVLRAGG